jgi:hypothetical protein
MGVHLHLIEHRLLGSMASLIATLMHLDQKGFRFSIPEIKRLEAEFRSARYYPDLLDERIVMIRKELQLILVDPTETTSRSEPAFL